MQSIKLLIDQPVLFKIGGSLLDLVDLGLKIQNLIIKNKISQPVIVAGGGEAANLVRQWHEIHGFSELIAHDLAIEAMRFNENLLLQLIPNSVLVKNREETNQAWDKKQIPILNCKLFIEEESKQIELKLPHHWGVTSDSIAAWIAIHWPMAALVLMKSVSIDSLNIQDQSEYVDGEFQKFVPKLSKIGWCNLRSSNPEVIFLNQTS